MSSMWLGRDDLPWIFWRVGEPLGLRETPICRDLRLNEWVSHMRSTRMVGGEEIRPLPTPPPHDPRPLLQRRSPKANFFQKPCRPMGLDLESNKWDAADVDREQHRRS